MIDLTYLFDLPADVCKAEGEIVSDIVEVHLFMGDYYPPVRIKIDAMSRALDELRKAQSCNVETSNQGQ